MHAILTHNGAQIGQTTINTQAASIGFARGIIKDDAEFVQFVKEMFILKLFQDADKWDEAAINIIYKNFYTKPKDQILQEVEIKILP